MTEVSRPLLMIPGPVELSPGVQAAFSVPPPGHLSSAFIEAFGASLERMRRVWKAGAAARPVVVAGGGTLAMEMAAANLVEPGDRVVVVDTGYFSERMAAILRRYGADVAEVHAPAGEAPAEDDVAAALTPQGGGDPASLLFATHVDTSTGVRLDPEPLARLARKRGALSVFDGVCATAAERFEMEAWGADVYYTASQKALGLPAGLALMVASERAVARRAGRRAPPPPMYLDWEVWRPVLEAYEERRPAYFSTPATNLVLALEVALREILARGMERRFALHRVAAEALGAAWSVLGLEPVPRRPELRAATLSALYLPDGVDASLLAKILHHGVVVAGGLHREIRDRSFRIGHMGYAVTRPEMLLGTVRAVAAALREQGLAVDDKAALAAARSGLESAPSEG